MRNWVEWHTEAHWCLPYLVPTAPLSQKFCLEGTAREGSLCCARRPGMCSRWGGRAGGGELSAGAQELAVCPLASPLTSLGFSLLIDLMWGLATVFTHLQWSEVQSHGKNYPNERKSLSLGEKKKKDVTPLNLRGSVFRRKKRPFHTFPLHWPPALICSLETCGSQTTEARSREYGQDMPRATRYGRQRWRS